MKRHRNLFREAIEAKERADGVRLELKQWAAWFNIHRPRMGGVRVRPLAVSTLARDLSATPGVARRISMDRAWMLKLLDVDYAAYVAAWASGPQEFDPTKGRRAGATRKRR